MTFNLVLAVVPDPDAVYWATVMNLPGAGGEGDTPADALAAAVQAAKGCLESYLYEGIAVPWAIPRQEDYPGATFHQTTVSVLPPAYPNVMP